MICQTTLSRSLVSSRNRAREPSPRAWAAHSAKPLATLRMAPASQVVNGAAAMAMSLNACATYSPASPKMVIRVALFLAMVGEAALPGPEGQLGLPVGGQDPIAPAALDSSRLTIGSSDLRLPSCPTIGAK